jgi:prophage antirepressor-like protein
LVPGTSTFDFTALIDGVSCTHAVRVVTLGGKPWFVAQDVCKALHLKPHPRGGFAHHTVHLPSDEKLRLERHTHMLNLWVSVAPQVVMVGAVSEAGLYRLVMRSKAPHARPFQDWVVREVLPSIRKHGAYALAEGETMPLPADVADALEEHAKTQVKLAVALREKAQAEAGRAEAEAALGS